MFFEQELLKAMDDCGLSFNGTLNLAPNKYHLFSSDQCKKKKCCRYRIFSGEVGAHICCWRQNVSHIWFFKNYQTLSPQEKSRFNKERQDQFELQDKIRQEATCQAREDWWNSTELDPEHPYVLRKKIIPYEARGYKNAIILPVFNIHGEIQSTQKIYADGSKRFASHAPAKAGFLRLGNLPFSKTFIFCEGWATGCSLYEAFSLTTFIAFSASNLPLIASSIRKKSPHSTFIFCADNDKNGIGKKYAIESAQTNSGIVLLPNISLNQGTDFNDLMVHEGMDSLINQIEVYL